MIPTQPAAPFSSGEKATLKLAQDDVVWVGAPLTSELVIRVVLAAILPLFIMVHMIGFIFIDYECTSGEIEAYSSVVALCLYAICRSLHLMLPLRYTITRDRCIIEYGSWPLSDGAYECEEVERTRKSEWRCTAKRGRGDVVFYGKSSGTRRPVEYVGFIGLEDVSTVANILEIDASLPMKGIRTQRS